MSATWIAFHLFIALIQSQRVSLFSWPLENNHDGWTVYPGTDSRFILNVNVYCPGALTCYRMSNYEELYIFMDTIGYTDIQIAYDIRTLNVNAGNACEFWYTLKAINVAISSEWHLYAQHIQNDEPKSTHTSLPRSVDNVSYFGIDFWANMGSKEYCYLNNVEITGIADTSNPTLSPSDIPSISPTDQPSTDKPTNVPSGAPLTKQPSSSPTNKPSSNPTIFPTKQPSLLPTDKPSSNPTIFPTKQPSLLPTDKPSLNPTRLATKEPSLSPTAEPSNGPAKIPSKVSNQPPYFVKSTVVDTTHVPAGWRAEKDFIDTSYINILLALAIITTFICIIAGAVIIYRRHIANIRAIFAPNRNDSSSSDRQNEKQNNIMAVDDANDDCDVNDIWSRLRHEIQNNIVAINDVDDDCDVMNNNIWSEEIKVHAHISPLSGIQSSASIEELYADPRVCNKTTTHAAIVVEGKVKHNARQNEDDHLVEGKVAAVLELEGVRSRDKCLKGTHPM